MSPLTAAHLNWTSEPMRRLEGIDVLTLNDSELLAHVADLAGELRCVRVTLYQALAVMAEQRDDLSTRARQIEALRRENRSLRETVAA